MQAEASHAGMLRREPATMEAVSAAPLIGGRAHTRAPSRAIPAYIDYGKPPRGRSTAQVTVLAALILVVFLVRTGAL